MSGWAIGFTAGMFTGGALGYFAAALMFAAGREDRRR